MRLKPSIRHIDTAERIEEVADMGDMPEGEVDGANMTMGRYNFMILYTR